jgi:hypothetical protein
MDGGVPPALQIIDITDFRTGVDVWFAHGPVPRRLMGAIDLLPASLARCLQNAGS